MIIVKRDFAEYRPTPCDERKTEKLNHVERREYEKCVNRMRKTMARQIKKQKLFKIFTHVLGQICLLKL